MFSSVKSLGVVDRNVLRRANLSFFGRAVTTLSQIGMSTWTWEKSPWERRGQDEVIRGSKVAAAKLGRLLRRAWIKHAAKTHR